MKTFFTILFSFLVLQFSLAQAVGGRGNGQSSPSETKASEVNAGGFSGDVSLFTGTYNTNYALGTVSTPSGISFTANMSYSSTFSSGDNPPHVSGVPYGEGWNIDIPSISVKTEDFNKYTWRDLLEINAKQPSVYPDADPTPLFNVDEEGNIDCEDAQREGEIFWFSPNVSIPGVFSGRMVYKYKDGGDYVFVPAKFERYVEARFRPDLGNSWEIILDDGTVYEMRPAVYSYRNAPNQRIQPDCIANPNDEVGNVFAEAVYEPKLEVLSWYCEKIHNPNLVGFIQFSYESYGCFNYFQEYETPQMLCARTNFFTSGSVGQKVPMWNICKDIILTSIEASGAERLVFDYENISSAGGFDILDPTTDPLVTRADNMYAKKSVYFAGDSEKPFNSQRPWKRYYHTKADRLNQQSFGINMASPTNPYLGTDSGGSSNSYYYREAVNQDINLPFADCFLESPRINSTDFQSGDIYEIRSKISGGGGGLGRGALFDVNIASGNYLNQGFDYLDGTIEKVQSGCHNVSRNQSIFSTFNQGVKWARNFDDTFDGNCVNSDGFLQTSNFFLMPNIPSANKGFNIQIGPANSDQKFNMLPSEIHHPDNGGNGISLISSYYNNDLDNDGNYMTCNNPQDPFVLKSGDPIPNNFGIGMPWHNLLDLYGFNDTTFPDFWWNFNPNHPDITYENEPTLTHNRYGLDEVELVRYSKTPYMLKSAKKQVWGPGETVTDFNEGAWQDVSNHEFGYQIKQVDKGTVYTETASNGAESCYSISTGVRNVVVLTSINQRPVDGGIGQPLTTSLEYEIFGEAFPNNGGIGFDNGLNTGFVLLKGITNPLGKKTTINYAPLDVTLDEQFCIPNGGLSSSSSSYILSTYKKRRQTNSFLNPCGGGGDGCVDGSTTTATPYTYQVFFTVSDIKIEDREGEKSYSYTFSEPHFLHNMPILGDHFARDDRYSYQLGFARTLVRGPVLASAQISTVLRTEYRHHFDNLLWGKLYEVKSYDASNQLLSESNINYDHVMAFEPPMQRYNRNSNGNWTDYFEYKEEFEWSIGRPEFDGNIGNIASYNEEMNNWLITILENNVANSNEYDAWWANRPFAPNITCYNCSDCEDGCDDSDCTIPQNQISECYCEPYYYPDMSSNDVNRCNNFWQAYNDWLAEKPETNSQRQLFNAHPPGFYESRYKNYIETADPAYLYSFFIKKTAESQTTYDQNCVGGTNAITSNTSYEYYDADYRGISTSGGYAAMGKDDSEFGLLWEPSWQLYKKESSSPQASGISTTEEYFYLWDLVNLAEYQQVASHFEPDPNFEPLWFNWAYRKTRNFPIETRITKSGGGGENVRSTYYVYDTGTTVDYAERTSTLVENPDDVFPCGDPVPPGNVPGNNTTGQEPSHNDPPVNRSAEQGVEGMTNNNDGTANSVYNYLSYFDDETQGFATINLDGKVMLQKVIEQVSKYDGDGEQPIVDYSINYDMPEFPATVDTLTVQTILARNAYGQVSKEMDEKFLVTEYEYKGLDVLVYPECQNGMTWYTWLHLQNNIGLPISVTVGAGLDNALTTKYEYNRDNTISKITDPNGMTLTYDYDGFLRMSAAYRNGKKIQEAEYNNANDGGGFIPSAQANYVKTFNFVNSSTGWGTKAYVDPLGRNAGNENYSEGSIVTVEDNVYDIYDRPFLKYKAHGGSPSMDGSPGDCGQAQFKFDTAPRSRVLESSKYGECLGGGHTVTYEHCLIPGGEMVDMLSQAAKSIPGCLKTSGMFMMTKTIDEDQKGVIEFTNAAGQKVATITNLDPGGIITSESSGTTFCYDEHGNVKEVSNAKEQTSRYTYNYLGQLINKNVPDATPSNFAYNQSGQVICDTDGVGIRVYDYDRFGRLIIQAKADDDYDMLNANFDGLPWIPDANRDYGFLEDALNDEKTKNEKEWFYENPDLTVPLHSDVAEKVPTDIANKEGRLVHAISYDNDGVPVESKYFSYNGDGFLAWEISQFNADGISGGGDKAVQITYPSYNLQGSYITQNVDIFGNDKAVDYQHHFVYDSWNRIDEVYANFNNLKSNGFKAVEYDYDDILGVVKKKRYYNSGEIITEEPTDDPKVCTNQFVDEITYTYDTRERLTNIESKLFNYGLVYDGSAINGGDQNWNGNINGSTADYLFEKENEGEEKIVLNRPTNFKDGTIYGYKYDGLNRLTHGKAVTNILDQDNPEPHIGVPSLLGRTYYEYDKIGNLEKLNRGTVYTNDDGVYEFGFSNHEYHYNAGNNQLLTVDITGQKKPNCLTDAYSYSYDGKGNLTSDSRRGIGGVAYGRANLPYAVGMSPTCENPGAMASEYLYDVNDARVYKSADQREYYQRDAAGHELFVFNYNTGKYCWYVYGNERVAKVCDKPEVIVDDPTDGCSIPPNCSDPELIAAQRRALDEGNLVYSPTELNFPTKLFRIKLCNGESVHLFRQELVNMPGNINIEQEIDIYNADQEFSVTRGENIRILTLSELMELRPNRDMIINGFDACAQRCITQSTLCTDAMQTAQNEALQLMSLEIQELRPYQMGIPTRLLRVRLCDATETYIPLDYWKRLPGNATILQQIEITDIEQTIQVTFGETDKGAQSLEHVLDMLLVTDRDVRLDGYETCLNPTGEECDPELPACPGDLAAMQYAAMTDIEQLFTEATIEDIDFPTRLYRLRLCYGDEIYVFQQELANIPANYKFLQEIQLPNAYMRLSLTLEDGGYILQGSLEDLLQQRKDWNLYAVNDYEGCGDVNPCHPNGPVCDPDEWKIQQASITTLQNNIKALDLNESMFPTYLNKVRFCDGSELYVFDFELPVIEGTFAIIQRFEVKSTAQTFEVLYNEELVSMTIQQIHELRQTNKDFLINGGGCNIIEVQANQECEYKIELENWKYHNIDNSTDYIVEYDYVHYRTCDGIQEEIWREEKSQIKPSGRKNGINNGDSLRSGSGFIDKVTFHVLYPSSLFEVDLNPSTFQNTYPGISVSPSDLIFDADSTATLDNAITAVINYAIEQTFGEANYIINVGVSPEGKVSIGSDVIHNPTPGLTYIGILPPEGGGSSKISYYPNGNKENISHNTSRGYRGLGVSVSEYLRTSPCGPLGVRYIGYIAKINRSDWHTITLTPSDLELTYQNTRNCEYQTTEYLTECGPPIVVYNGCDEIVCNANPQIPLPKHPFDKKECCSDETGDDGPVIIMDDGKKREIYLQKENQVFKETKRKMWQRMASNISYPNNLHKVRFDNGKELTLLDEEIRELDGCGKIIKSTPIPTKDQKFSVTLKLDQSSIRAGTATLSNVLQLRSEGVPMSLTLKEDSELPPLSPDDGETRIVPFFTFFVHDHLGNSRVLYHNKFTSCDEEGTRYVLEHVLDYYPYGKTLREYTLQRERFQTTHHERDAETGLDYRGARFYDSEVGRFLSRDPLAEKAFNWTPYRIDFDNPVRYMDPDGMFEIEHLKEDNPELYEYLSNIMTTYQGKSGDFKDAFKQYSQLSDKQINAILTPGQGPKVVVSELKGANGNTPINMDAAGNAAPLGMIVLDAGLVGDFEASRGIPVSADGAVMQQAIELGLESTVFHELTHFGDALNGKMDMTAYTTKKGFGGARILSFVKDGAESGKLFERAAYGQDLLNGVNPDGTLSSSRYGDARMQVLNTNPNLATKVMAASVQRDHGDIGSKHHKNLVPQNQR